MGVKTKCTNGRGEGSGRKWLLFRQIEGKGGGKRRKTKCDKMVHCFTFALHFRRLRSLFLCNNFTFALHSLGKSPLPARFLTSTAAKTGLTTVGLWRSFCG